MVEITITPVANGFVVRAGCQMFAFRGHEELSVELIRWLANPQAVEQEWRKKLGDLQPTLELRGGREVAADSPRVQVPMDPVGIGYPNEAGGIAPVLSGGLDRTHRP